VLTKATVLIIDGDEWMARSLATFLKERRYAAHVEHEARKGFDRARALKPDCIVCSIHLPDIDGFWVARSIRAESGPVSKTPFVFLTEAGDKDAKLKGFRVGADMYLERPYTHEEIVAQIEALIEMAERLRDFEAAPSPPNEPSSRALGIILKGDIARMGVPTVLTMLEMERRTGELMVECDDGKMAIFFLEDGGCIGARFQNLRAKPVDTLRHVLTWKVGKFHFMVTDHRSPAQNDVPVSMSHLLLEASRLNDEADAT
jgi:two-component system OmpR family response regulator